MESSFQALRERIVACRRCPRLVHFRENVVIRTPCTDPWRRPVPGFGDEKAKLLIVGLAPSVEGGNRTGRIFTGDASAVFLFRALYEAGFSNQSVSQDREDGLILHGCYITASVKCVPPKHHPTPEEFFRCSSYLENEFFLLKQVRAVLALGKMAFDAYQRFLFKQGVVTKKVPFSHGSSHLYPGWPTLYGSFHPSPQNTNTGKLTLPTMVQLLKQIQKLL
jgi:uracil-DNA glycosylase